MKPISAILMLTTVAVLGCDDAPAENSSDPVVAAWQGRGLQVSAPTPLPEQAITKACARYDVSGVTAVICDYDDPAAALSARKKGLSWVGDATGSSLVREQRLLVVVDRDGIDREGRTIQALTEVFLQSTD